MSSLSMTVFSYPYCRHASAEWYNSVSCLQLDELLDALRTATFDVLLTDVQMPAINGLIY